MFRSISRSARALLTGVACVFSVATFGAPGTDVTVFDLIGTQNYGATNGIRGYAVGTTSCNVGTEPLSWCAAGRTSCTNGVVVLGPDDHPVIAQNMYRLKAGRFEQLGASWLKHGFTSLNLSTPGCGTGTCQQPPLGGDQLGVGCTDPYNASLNGTRPLGRKSEVNATTGIFPVPIGGGGATSALWNQRLAVAEAEIDPALNPGARYFVEGHYVAADDAIAGNGLNNASYREVTVAANFNLNLVNPTVRERAAIHAWKAIDPAVEILEVDVGTSPIERFHVARKVTQPAAGLWHYEYAIHNMNSDRASDRLRIEFGQNTTFSQIGFRDVNAHSNEPYDTTDWTASTSANAIQWEAPAFPSSPVNGNAIRWGTMYSFWFDATSPPTEIAIHNLRLFKPGSPTSINMSFSDSNILFTNGFE